MVWADAGHASVFDAVFFSQESDFLVGTIEFGLQPHASVDAVCSPTAGVGRGELCQGDDVENCRADMAGPGLGE